ncbi:hypothetical protein AB837_00626 [bacterium AB1]|nr:hypothetical protein AB837_00626 [bacterium AB1]
MYYLKQFINIFYLNTDVAVEILINFFVCFLYILLRIFLSIFSFKNKNYEDIIDNQNIKQKESLNKVNNSVVLNKTSFKKEYNFFIIIQRNAQDYIENISITNIQEVKKFQNVNDVKNAIKEIMNYYKQQQYVKYKHIVSILHNLELSEYLKKLSEIIIKDTHMHNVKVYILDSHKLDIELVNSLAYYSKEKFNTNLDQKNKSTKIMLNNIFRNIYIYHITELQDETMENIFMTNNLYELVVKMRNYYIENQTINYSYYEFLVERLLFYCFIKVDKIFFI